MAPYVSFGWRHGIVFPPPEYIPTKGASVVSQRSLSFGDEIIPESLPKLLYRNKSSYGTRLRLSGGPGVNWIPKNPASEIQTQLDYYYQHYENYVPRELLLPLLTKETLIDARQEMDRQGNAITTFPIESSDNTTHAVIYATGPIQQQVSAFCITEGVGAAAAAPTFIPETDRIEIGSTIRQFELMKKDSTVQPVLVRGAATASIVDVDTRDKTSVLSLHHRLSIPFPELLQHCAPSPYVSNEAAFVSSRSGIVSTWTADSNALTTVFGAKAVGAAARCVEYSAHPVVLWCATKSAVGVVDTRAEESFDKIYDLSFSSSSSSYIVGIKRNPKNPYQFVVQSNIALEMIDSRYPNNSSVFAWDTSKAVLDDTKTTPGDDNNNTSTNRHRLPIGGPLLSITDATTTDVTNRTLIFAGQSVERTTSVYGYTSSSNDDDFDLVKCSSVIKERKESSSSSPYVSMGTPLDLMLQDLNVDLTLAGVTTIRMKKKVAANASLRQSNATSPYEVLVLQCTSLGDIYQTRIGSRNQRNEGMVHQDLPIGVTALLNSSEKHRKLDIPSSAFMPEYDAKTIAPYFTLDVPKLLKGLQKKNKVKQLTGSSAKQSIILQAKEEIFEILLTSRYPLSVYTLAGLVATHLKQKVCPRMLGSVIVENWLEHHHNQSSLFLQVHMATYGPVSSDVKLRVPQEEKRIECQCIPKDTGFGFECYIGCESPLCVIPHATIVTIQDRHPKSIQKKRKMMIPPAVIRDQSSTMARMLKKLPDTWD